MPQASSRTMLGTSATSRLRTTVGRCPATTRMAESGRRVPARTIPSTPGSARRRLSRSRVSDSCASMSSRT
ncbi:hypothetical protein BJF79_15645 [Actinomadura sp. CNU-125]|nr:hypothetical protein BJF79_15645 [Actinomadura sp. CNU-125]